MSNIVLTNIVAVDSEEMKKAHLRFNRDIMGEPKFNGIRIDAEKNHPIEGVTIQNLRYHCAGGVKQADIPERYPELLDQLVYPDAETSENYYPNWSRATFMDMQTTFLPRLCISLPEKMYGCGE